ncbi:hypothetical protein AGABI1DRAFT_127291 [Agaricus bisporus var. burnettii JB137-S8]|uniref:Uncharacterized protein n=1 Tax=Agaricus bisporus var. burnettii (strain JB137-S8 / ATCC MYA-4627 / FGSC 10392) TaxID=597362 RepID=K5XDN5_AGABU|nr:uncharacterized protein AGABI1DRAFT_127291 [Agaricus bisporus var. burnettii JB137-S8]EKM81277.1 hypothetical protein AGABI1DRAFT_127291 [Agaricus bisporus var. burnettii JB137-S8]
MFSKFIRKFRPSSDSAKPAAHTLPLNYSDYDYDAESLHDGASFATSFGGDSISKQPTLVETPPSKHFQAEMLEDDNMAWGPTKVRKVKPTPPYVQPPSHYLQKASHPAEPESHYVRRAETLESENVAQWSRVPKGRKMKPASQYVERAELLEEDNRAW